MSPYKILGVSEQASDEEVKRAYLAMAAKYHPDAGGDAWVFAQVREAYDRILKSRRLGSNPGSQQAGSQQAGSQQAGNHQTGSHRPRESNPYQPPLPADYSAQPTSYQRETHSAGKRIYDLLFRQQLPLQSETSYFILVNVLDIVFTNLLLRMDAMEANPIANYILIYWGFPGMIAFKLFLVAFVCLITQLIAFHHLRRARQTLYLGTAIVSTVVAYSAFLLWRGHH